MLDRSSCICQLRQFGMSDSHAVFPLSQHADTSFGFVARPSSVMFKSLKPGTMCQSRNKQRKPLKATEYCHVFALNSSNLGHDL